MGEEVWYPLGIWYAAANVILFLIILAKNNALNQETLTNITQNMLQLTDELYDYLFEPCGYQIEFINAQSEPPPLYNRPIVAASTSRFQPSVSPIQEVQNYARARSQSNLSSGSISLEDLNIQIPKVREIISSVKLDPTEKIVENAKKTIEEHKKYSEKKLEELRRAYKLKKKSYEEYRISDDSLHHRDIQNTAAASSKNEKISDPKFNSTEKESRQEIDTNKKDPNKFAGTVLKCMELEKSKIVEDEQTEKTSAEKDSNSQVGGDIDKIEPESKDKTEDKGTNKKNDENIVPGKDNIIRSNFDKEENKKLKNEIINANSSNKGQEEEPIGQSFRMEPNKQIPEHAKVTDTCIDPNTLTGKIVPTIKKQEKSEKKHVGESRVIDSLEPVKYNLEWKKHENKSIDSKKANLLGIREQNNKDKQLTSKEETSDQISSRNKDNDTYVKQNAGVIKTFDFKENLKGKQNDSESIDIKNRTTNLAKGQGKKENHLDANNKPNKQNPECARDAGNAFKMNEQQFYKQRVTGNVLNPEKVNLEINQKEDYSVDKNKEINTYKQTKDQEDVKEKSKIYDNTFIVTKRKNSAVQESGTKELNGLKNNTLTLDINKYRKLSDTQSVEGKLTHSKYEDTTEKSADGKLISNKVTDEPKDCKLAVKNNDTKITKLHSATSESKSTLNEEELEQFLDKLRTKSTLFK